MVKTKILIVEDNIAITEGLQYILEKQGFIADIVNTKQEALDYINSQEFDLALLDIQLPDGTGFDICKYIKEKNDKPVIFVSGRIEEVNIVYGLDIGADDYIVKPYKSNELISRINCVLRRYNKCKCELNNTIEYNNIKIDVELAKVYKNKKEIYLTPLEYKILVMFIKNKGKLVTREQLLDKIWDIEGKYVNNNTLTVYIKRLRSKIEDSIENEIIKTIRGIGYILK
ncbi:MAG: response regulator transcription factor [Clostridiales bacterium]|nr:response regulator transcription factor [Clostridiales bacterium]